MIPGFAIGLCLGLCFGGILTIMEWRRARASWRRACDSWRAAADNWGMATEAFAAAQRLVEIARETPPDAPGKPAQPTVH